MKTTINILSLTIVAILMLGGCAAQRTDTGTKLDKTTIISYRQTPCYGQCPIFTMTIDGTGAATYRGERFTEKEGLYQKQLNMREVRDVITALDRAEFMHRNDEYLSGATDLSQAVIKYTRHGKSKQVRSDFAAPDQIKAVIALLKDIANSDGWQKIEAE